MTSRAVMCIQRKNVKTASKNSIVVVDVQQTRTIVKEPFMMYMISVANCREKEWNVQLC